MEKLSDEAVEGTCGYRFKFVQVPPEPLICSICRLPARDPRLSRCCRYNFCETCLDSRAKDKSNKLLTCPVCSDYNFTTDINKQARTETLSLQIYCPNRAKGCSWKGKIHEVNDHMIQEDGCQVVQVLCRCGRLVVRGNLTDHYRNHCPLTPQVISCRFCNMRGEKKVIEGEHMQHCLKCPVPCSNNCDIGNIVREEMSTHLEVCSLQLVYCEYHQVGCNVKTCRQDLDRHSNEYTSQHLDLVRISLAATDEEVITTKQQLAEANTQLSTAHRDLTNMLLDVAGLVQTMAGDDASKSKFSARSKHWRVWLRCSSMQSASQCLEAPIIIRVTGYEHKRHGKKVWYSEPFWTHHKGYKAQIKVHADGFGDYKGTHFSMGICIRDGPNDKDLAWPVVGTFTMRLLNQIADDKHYAHHITFDRTTPQHIGGKMAPTDDDRISAWGKWDFITHGDLRKSSPACCYLKDDTLYLQISFRRGNN